MQSNTKQPTFGAIVGRPFGQVRYDNHLPILREKEQNQSVTKPANGVTNEDTIDEFENIMLRPSTIYRVTGAIKYSVTDDNSDQNLAPTGNISLKVTGASIPRVYLSIIHQRYNASDNAVKTTIEALNSWHLTNSVYPSARNITYPIEIGSNSYIKTGNESPFVTFNFKINHSTAGNTLLITGSIKSGSWLLFEEVG